MQGQQYYVVLINNDNIDVQQQLTERLKLSEPVAQKLFSTPYSVIKRKLERERAQQYHQLITGAGGLCKIIEEGTPFDMSQLNSQHTSPTLSVSLGDDSTSVIEDTATTSEPLNESSVTSAKPIAGAKKILPENKVFCRGCARVIDSSADVCPVCGEPQMGVNAKSKTTATVLAFCLGGFGIHRLYLNQWWGIFYIIFASTLIPFVIAIIESIVFLCTSKVSWDKKYAKVPNSSGTTLLFVAAAIVCVCMTGLLAAIALPAYQDYTVRAKVSAGMPLVRESQQQLSDFIERTGFLPNQNIDAGLPETINGDYIQSITVSDGGVMTVIFTNINEHSASTLVFTPTLNDNQVTWECNYKGTLAIKYRPQECRDSSKATIVAAPENQRDIIQNPQTMISADGRMSIVVPDSWSERTDLNDAADLQAGNIYQDVYFIALGEPKSDFEVGTTLAQYRDLVTTPFFNVLDNLEVVSGPTSTTINNQPAFIFEVVGTVDQLRVHYFVVTAQSDGEFFQLLGWSTHSRFDGKRQVLSHVIDSFSVQ